MGVYGTIWLAAVFCFFWMVLYLRACEGKRYRTAFCFKLLAGLGFLGAGLLLPGSGRFAALLRCGLGFGLLGDQLLALRYLLPARRSLMFALGGLAFAAGHLLYLLAAFSRGVSLPLTLPLAAGLFGLVALYLKRSHTDAGKLQGAAFGYIGLVALLAAACAAALASGRALWPLALAALSFLLSDSLLLSCYFGSAKSRGVNRSLHISYYAAQLLFAFCVTL